MNDECRISRRGLLGVTAALGAASVLSQLSRASAQPYNVDTVVVDGRILKRNRQLTAVDVTQVVRDAAEAQRSVLKRALGK